MGHDLILLVINLAILKAVSKVITTYIENTQWRQPQDNKEEN